MTVFDQIVTKKATENYKNSPEKAHADMCKALKKDLVSTYGKRVGKIISMIKSIKKNDAKTWDSPEMRPFFTDAMDHRFGYFRYGEHDALGNRAGGFCGEHDFTITSKKVDFDDVYDDSEYFSRSRFSLNCAKDFPEIFEEYEAKFFEFIKTTYGQDALDAILEND